MIARWKMASFLLPKVDNYSHQNNFKVIEERKKEMRKVFARGSQIYLK